MHRPEAGGGHALETQPRWRSGLQEFLGPIGWRGVAEVGVALSEPCPAPRGREGEHSVAQSGPASRHQGRGSCCVQPASLGSAPGSSSLPESPRPSPPPPAPLSQPSASQPEASGWSGPFPSLLWRLVSACSCCLAPACNLVRFVPSSHCCEPRHGWPCSSGRMYLVAVLLSTRPSLCAFSPP